MPGMSGNVRKNLEELGCAVCHITNENKIIKTRIIDSKFNNHIVRLDDHNEGCDTLEDSHIEDIEDKIISKIRFDAVIISDYDKGFLPYDSAKHLIDTIRKYNEDCPIFVDTKKTDVSCYNEVFLKINELESARIKNNGKENNVITTLGKRGAMYNGKMYDSRKTDVSDICGAGDTFISSLAFSYLCENKDIEKAIKFSNISSSISVRNIGVYSPTIEDLKDAGVIFEK